MGVSSFLYRSDHILFGSDGHFHNHNAVNAIFIRFRCSEVHLQHLTMVPEQNIDAVNRESRKNVDHVCCHGGNAHVTERSCGVTCMT